MAIILFKAGNSHKVNGIPCQIQVCNEFSYLHLLEQGWFYTPEECYAEEEEPELVEVPEIEEEAETTEEPMEAGEEPIDEIRAAAREAGISHWHNKSIERLVSELKDTENAERSED